MGVLVDATFGLAQGDHGAIGMVGDEPLDRVDVAEPQARGDLFWPNRDAGVVVRLALYPEQTIGQAAEVPATKTGFGTRELCRQACRNSTEPSP